MVDLSGEVEHPFQGNFCVALSFGIGLSTLLIEGSFGLFIFPKLRKHIALLAILMHLGISLFVGLHHFDWMFIVLGLGFFPRHRIENWPVRKALASV